MSENPKIIWKTFWMILKTTPGNFENSIREMRRLMYYIVDADIIDGEMRWDAWVGGAWLGQYEC